MKKLLIAMTLGGALVAGAVEPAQARVFFGFGVGGPGIYYPHHFHPRCVLRTVKVKVWSPGRHHFVWRWTTRRVCW